MKMNNGNLIVPARQLENSIVYTDRNGVFHKIKSGNEQVVRDTINKLNEVCRGELKVITNESEDPKSNVLNTDKQNGVLMNPDNYHLSTESAVAFIRKELGFNKCFFVGNEAVLSEVQAMGMEVINLSVNTMTKFLKGYTFMKNPYPILFARPPFAIEARYTSQEAIDESISWDFSLDAARYIVQFTGAPVVFCHSKPNCIKMENDLEFMELNLGYYFQWLRDRFELEIGKNLFDLGKGGHSQGEIFDVSLGIDDGDYSQVIGIGDMMNDIEHTVRNGGTGILTLSGDEVMTDELLTRVSEYNGKINVVSDLSKVLIGD